MLRKAQAAKPGAQQRLVVQLQLAIVKQPRLQSGRRLPDFGAQA